VPTIFLAAWLHALRGPAPDGPDPATGGFAVLVTWPDGSRTLECLSVDFERASRQVQKMRRFWRLGPHGGARVVAVTDEQWRTHRRPCRNQRCWCGQ
jgi:hypothetical protein